MVSANGCTVLRWHSGNISLAKVIPKYDLQTNWRQYAMS